METLSFFLVACAILAYGMVSGRLARSPFSSAMAFVALGVLLGPLGLDLVHFDVEGGMIRVLAELTLALVLFTDAARIDLRQLRRERSLPLRMLLIGLPLTVVAGTATGVWLLGLPLWTAAVLSSILAPTDAALGQPVVTDLRVPGRIRQTLNAESGLNDGIALPVVLLALSLAGSAEAQQPLTYWLRFVGLQLLLGPVIGVAVGWGIGHLVSLTTANGWMNDTFQRLAALGLALAAFALAELVGGNGFIAAFVAGMTLGNTARQTCSCLYEFGEAEGNLLTLLMFMMFGATLLPLAADSFAVSGLSLLPVIAYIVVSLTAARMVPIAISLLGARLHPATYLFLGWFGPRGLATILFGLLVVEEAGMDGELVLSIAMGAVLLSVVAHGVSAAPAAGWYARVLERRERQAGAAEPPMPEHVAVPEMPARAARH